MNFILQMLYMDGNIYRTSDLLNPCRVTDSRRQQSSSDSERNSYNATEEVRFSLPTDAAILDMTQSYIDYDVFPTINNASAIIAETKTSFTINSPNGATVDGGDFYIVYDGESSAPIQWNATAVEVQEAIEAMQKITGKQFLVHCSGGPLPADVDVEIGNFDGYNIPLEASSYITLNSNSINDGGVPWNYIIIDYVPGVLSSPRVEQFAPFFVRAYIQINSDTVYETPYFNILTNIDYLTKDQNTRDAFDYTNASSIYGTGFGFYENNDLTKDQSFGRRKFFLNMNLIGLFRKLLPVGITGSQVRLFLKTDTPTNALIIESGTFNNNNPNNESYQILNAKLHYHVLTIPDYEEEQLKAMYNDENRGLILDFRSWSNYTSVVNANSGNLNVIFNPSQRSFLGLYFTMYSIPYSGISSNSRKFSTFLRNNLDHFKLKIGTVYYPSDDIQSSNTYPNFVQQIQELNRFTGLVNYTAILNNNQLCMKNYTQFVGNDATQYSLDIPYNIKSNQSCIFAIATSDVGVDVENKLCNIALNGVDTSSNNNVQLELAGMGPVLEDCQLNMFYMHQDYLKFTRSGVVWVH